LFFSFSSFFNSFFFFFLFYPSNNIDRSLFAPISFKKAIIGFESVEEIIEESIRAAFHVPLLLSMSNIRYSIKKAWTKITKSVPGIDIKVMFRSYFLNKGQSQLNPDSKIRTGINIKRIEEGWI
jgi:hypothetical protein